MEGWVKLHRQFIEWEWYDKSETVHLFLHCLLKANHKDKMYRGTLVKAGTFLTSRDLLSKELGLSVRQIRTSLGRLKKTNELAINSSTKGTVIEVVKYSYYQIEPRGKANKSPAIAQVQPINKNDKNNKNDNIYRTFSHLTLYEEDFIKLKQDYSDIQINEVLDSIENFKQNTKYKSLYLTAKNWLKRIPKEEEDKLIQKAKRLGYA